MSDEAQLAYEQRMRTNNSQLREVHSDISELSPSRRADEQSLKAIVSDMWQHGERLIKAEVELGIELGKAELDRQVEQGKITLRHTAIMSGLFYAGYLTLLAALVLGLSELMPAFLAAALVGVVSGIAGYALLKHEIKEVKETVHETKQALAPRDRISNTAAPRAQH